MLLPNLLSRDYLQRGLFWFLTKTSWLLYSPGPGIASCAAARASRNLLSWPNLLRGDYFWLGEWWRTGWMSGS